MSKPVYQITFIAGTARVETALFPGGYLMLGRGREADIRVTDVYVNLWHALIEHGPDGPVIVDLGSQNGTYLNGTRVEGPTILREGDRLTIGSTVITLERCARPAPLSPRDRMALLPVEVIHAAQRDEVLCHVLTMWAREGQVPVEVGSEHRVDADVTGALAFAVLCLVQSRQRLCDALLRQVAETGAPRW